MNYGGFAKAYPRTVARIAICSSCGEPMTGSKRPVVDATCSNCVVGVTPRSRREWRASVSRRARKRLARR